MTKKSNTNKTVPPVKQEKDSSNQLAFAKEALTLLGGLAGSILAVYGLIKTFREDAAGFFWLIPVGVVVWLIILVRLFQTRRTTSYSLFIASILIGGIGWIAQQSEIKATENKIIVLVAKFDGPEEKYHLRDEILKQLRTTTKNYGDTEIIALNQIITEAEGSEYAKEVGEKKQADLVIWGWYTETEISNLNLYVENLSEDKLLEIPESQSYASEVSLDEFESLSIQYHIGSETSSVISFIAGFVQYGQGDYEIALDRYNQALEGNEKNAFIDKAIILTVVGNCQIHLLKYEDAVASYTLAIQLNPDYASAYTNRGLAYRLLNEHDLAFSDYDKAIMLDPSNADWAYNNRGVLYWYLDQFYLALDDLNHAVQVDPSFAVAYLNRGNTFGFLGQFENAIKDFDKAIFLEPNFALAYVNRGNAYKELGQSEAAIKNYDQAIAVDPTMAIAFYNRGIFYENIGNFDLATQDYIKTIQLDPTKLEAHLNLGNIYYYLGNYDQAIVTYNEILKYDPKFVNTYINRGNAYDGLQKYEQAISNYSTAIELDPNSADAYYNRGLVYQKVGRFGDAEADFQKYEELTGEKP